jgi:hypothetical protein
MVTTLTLPSEAQAPPTPGVVEIDVRLTPLDLYRAERTIVWRQVRLMVMLAAAFVSLRVLLGGGVPLLLIVAVLGLFCFAAHSGFLYMGARSTLRTSRVLGGTIHYSFETRCMRLSAETYWSIQDWSNLHEVLETRQLLILRSSSAQKVVIPKRCLRAGDLEKIRVLARKSPVATLAPSQATHAPSPGSLTANVLMEADDLYQGFLILLVRKSYWSAAQMFFSFVLFFAVNPNFLSPTRFVFFGTIFTLFVAISLYRSSGKAIRTNAAYQSAIAYSFGVSGLDSNGSTFAFHHDWCNFQSVIEGSKIFVFCPSNAQMLIIPKRSFTDAAQISALRELLKTHFLGKLSLKR